MWNMQQRKYRSWTYPQDVESMGIYILDLFFNSLFANNEIGGKYYTVLEVTTTNTKIYAICMWNIQLEKCKSFKYPQDVESMGMYILDLFFNSLSVNKEIGIKSVTVLQITTTNIENFGICMWNMQPKGCRSSKYPEDVDSMRICILDLFLNSLSVTRKIGG